MTSKPKILIVRDGDEQDSVPMPSFGENTEVVEVRSPIRAMVRLVHEAFDGVYVAAQHLSEAFKIGKLLQNERILEGMPDGVAVLDADNTIIWGNARLLHWSGREQIIGQKFYEVLNSPEILGPDFCPFHTALATGKASSSTLRSADNHYFHVHAAPVLEPDQAGQNLIVTIRDVTHEVLQQQKLAAIHQAGVELADLTPDELLKMSVQERVDLLKSNILHFTKDLLHFDVVEIRMLDLETRTLEPLLSLGMTPEAANRKLKADLQGNGVTGFVAVTGKSYLCEDTTEDPLYLVGAQGAKSSLTVPLMLHDQVIGTFNVESPEPHAFTESDLQFLEIFTRDVAVALNTLELLNAEKASAAAESVEHIHKAVALPVDVILNDAVNVMERYIGHEPDVVERLQRILRNARDIKLMIQKVGQKMAPTQALPPSMQGDSQPLLRGRRILVVDADESVRIDAHKLLERYGCIVETAHDAGEAVFMVRNAGPDPYDVIIAEIRLPDMSGYQLFLRLQDIIEPVPIILMTGFGYDPGHSQVSARKAGLEYFLYKPFRLEQLLQNVERCIQSPGPKQPAPAAS